MHIKKRTKNKIKKSCEGVITLFLCILMTPFLMIASALIEFSRYQEAEELVNELMNCSSLSVLANFDKYLEERFGIFGVAQDCDIQKTYSESMSNNIHLMGGNAGLGDEISAEGTIPLSQIEVLKSQLMDFSESTVLTEILLEDLNLGDLIEKLDNLSAIQRISTIATTAGNVTGSVSDLVQTGDAFLEKITAVKEKVKSLKGELESFIGDVKSLIQSFGSEDDITLGNIKENYLGDVKNIYKKGQSLVENAKSLVDDFQGLKDSFVDCKEKVKATVESFKNAKSTVTEMVNEAKEDNSEEESQTLQKAGDSSTKTYEDAVNALDKAFDQSKEDLINSTKDIFATEFENLKSNLKSQLGDIITDTQKDLDEYFTGDLSSDAERDLGYFVSLASTLYGEYKEHNDINDVADYIKEEMIPACFFDTDLEELTGIFKNAVESAANIINDNIESAVDNVIGQLFDTIKGLFDLDVFYNKDLNAYVIDTKVNNEGDNPYVALLDGINKLVDAGNELVKAMDITSGEGPIKRAIRLLKAVKNAGEGIVTAVSAVIKAAELFIKNVSEIGSYIFNNNWQGLYERLLLAGYSVHNMPNRTMCDYNITEGKMNIEGEALTGFSFANLSVPTGAGTNSEDDSEDKFKVLQNLMNQYSPSNHNNPLEMFKGAELEYIAVGTQSEIMNQVVCFFQIYMLRMLLDVIPVLKDPGVQQLASAAGPFFWVVDIIAVILEPLCDTVLLVNSPNSQAPFVKTSCYVTLTGLPKLAAALLEATGSGLIKHLSENMGLPDSGDVGLFDMDYKSHMLLVILFTLPTENELQRISNLINLETAYHYKQEGADYTFSLSNAYTSINTKSEIELYSFISVFQTNSESGAVKGVLSRTKGY